jgi:hypothetical protein
MALFDLEIQKVSELTNAGITKLSDIYYGSTDLMTSARWGSALCLDKSFYKTTKPLSLRYQALKNVSCKSFISHVGSTGAFSIYKLLLKRGSTIPMWTAGIATFFRIKVRISNNNFRELAKYDALFDRYYGPIGVSASVYDIDVTINKIYQGTADISKDFIVSRHVSTVAKVDTIPKLAERYSIFVNGDKLYCSRYSTTVVEIADITYAEDWKSFEYKVDLVDGDVFYDTTYNKVFIKEDGKLYNYQHRLSFEESRDDYCFIVEPDMYTENNPDTIYISNFKDQYTNDELGTISPASIVEGVLVPKTQFFTVKEYPFTLDNIKFYNASNAEVITGISCTIIRNVVKVTTSLTSTAIRIVASYKVVPIISLNRSAWPVDKDVRHFLADFSPNIVSFTNGTICLFGKESDMSLRPASLTVSTNKDSVDKDGKIIVPVLEALGNIRVTATLKNIDEVPLSGRNVTLSVVDDIFKMGKWAGDPDANFQAKTNMAGEINGTLINSQMKFGWCLQKEWAGDVLLTPDQKHMVFDTRGIPQRDPLTKNRLYIPFETGLLDPNRVYLYMITADDPILGMVAAYWNNNTGEYVEDKSFVGTKVKEYYGRSGQLSSYDLVARKIAYVDIMSVVNSDNSLSIETRFKKPKAIKVVTGKEIIVRDSVIYSNLLSIGIKDDAKTLLTKYLESTEVNDFEVIDQLTTFYTDRFGWDNKWLLSENKVTYLKVKPTYCSYIEFETDVPGLDDPNVIGYFMIADLGGKILVQAEHVDETTATVITSNKLAIDIESYIKSQSAFTLAENKPSDFHVNNFIGSFGYMSISDYVDSPFGINACSMICRFSHGKQKCRRPAEKDVLGNVTLSYRDTYHVTDDSVYNMWCLHSDEYDAQPGVVACPGRESRLVNPFLLHVTKEE